MLRRFSREHRGQIVVSRPSCLALVHIKMAIARSGARSSGCVPQWAHVMVTVMRELLNRGSRVLHHAKKHLVGQEQYEVLVARIRGLTR